jgi:serine phosphatase RsbU (regulator of sigma subunit)
LSPEGELIDKLTTLNHIAETLNQAVDVRGVLNDALADMVKLMGLETGWIFLKDSAAQERWAGSGYVLAAHHNLPPALDLHSAAAWDGGCTCQELCNESCLHRAYNEVHCSRLRKVSGDRRGLAMHASTPLRAGDRILGILNVAGPDWSAFSPAALSILTNVGNQIGTALERARLFDLLQERRIHEQIALLDLSQQLLARRDLDNLIGYLVDQVRQMLEIDACALVLPGADVTVLSFQAASGWRVDPAAEQRQAPADEQSGPGLVLRTQQSLMVEDLEEDDPHPWMPDWLRAEGFRGHAVVPLVAEGRSVGVLIVNSRAPRLLSEEEMRLLRLMANQAAIAIEKARLHQEELKKQSMERDLEVGKQIQLSMLPDACPVVPGWECAAIYKAARVVGGDFYDFFPLSSEPAPDGARGPDRLGMLIADVAGKGVPAALFMARGCTTIRTTALVGNGPATALIQANRLIFRDRQSQLFLTALYAVLDTENGRLVYANAGHNPPLWLQAATGDVQALEAGGIVLGIFGDVELEEHEIRVAPGDLLVFYTDGVTEAMDTSHDLFGEERLQATVAANANASAQEVLDAILAAIREFTGDVEQSDDLTLFIIRRSPEAN